jgi:FlaA1/EpsC-like NDP-sugar epimerase
LIEPLRPIIDAHAPASIVFVALFLYNGIYSAKQYSVKNIFSSAILSSAIFMSWIYFMTDYPPAPFGAALVPAIFLAIAWRETLPLVVNGIKGCIFAPETVLIIGHGQDILQYIKKTDGRRDTRIAGIIKLGTADSRSQIEGYPVLGNMNDLAQTLENDKIDALVIVAAQPWYSDIINILTGYKRKGLDIRWEAMEFARDQNPKK